MATKQLFGNDARKKLLDGKVIVNKTVAPTLGASGRNVAYSKWNGRTTISNDGLLSAMEIDPEDEGEKQGADLSKQVMNEVNEEAGDATSTTCVLDTEISIQGVYILDDLSKKINSTKLKNQIITASKKVIAEISAAKISTDSLEDLEKIAITSVEDPEIGKTIAKAVHDAGENGIVYVDESNEPGVTVEKSDGYQIPAGLISPYLLTNYDKIESVLENPAVLITDILVSFNEDFMNLIKTITSKTRDILIICDEFHPDVVKFAVKNIQAGNFRLMIVKKPMQKEYFEDIASLVGATTMTNQKGVIKYSADYIGSAKKIVITPKTTTIFEGGGIEQTAKEIESIKVQIEETKDEGEKTKLQERLARFTGGIYVINVGAKTPAEQKYLKDKVDDAVNATKKAKGGYVAGGGVTLYNIAKKLISESNEINDGELVVYTACQKPIRQIIENSGEDVNETLKAIDAIEGKLGGYDALALKVVPNMIDAGITDSIKSTLSSFSIASSNASLFLTIETLIIPIVEKQSDRQ